MELGLFTRLIRRDSLEETFKACKDYGLYHQQFNMSCAGLPSLPETYEQDVTDEILRLAEQYGMKLDGISGTFNMIEPDEAKRAKEIENFDVLCHYAHALRIPYINLCAGSKSPKGKFVQDPLNETEEAWKDLLDTAKKLVVSAEKWDVTLCLEVETCIIVDTAEKGRRLLDEVNSDRLKIVMDNGNLLFGKGYPDANEALKHGFDLLGKDVVLANLKDYKNIDGKDVYVAPGKGEMDFPYYVSLLKEYGYEGALMLHGLSEEEIPFSVEYMKGIL